MPELSGRVALVTGGTKGIGQAVALALAEAGASVMVSARTTSEVERVVREMEEAFPDRIAGMPCDVRRPDSCRELIEQTTQRFGGLDILVNNAGVGIFKPLQEMTDEEWRRQLETNLDSVFYLSKAAVPHLIDSAFAWIINVGSLASRNAFGGGAGYNASKFGLLGLSEAMMHDLRHQGIRVSIVMPGSVDTDFSQPEGSRPWATKRMRRVILRQPIPRKRK